jgi:hypothetical protein
VPPRPPAPPPPPWSFILKEENVHHLHLVVFVCHRAVARQVVIVDTLWRGCGRGPLCVGVRTAMTLTLPPLSNLTCGCGRDNDTCVRTRDARGAPRPFLPLSILLLLPLLSSPVVVPHRSYVVFFTSHQAGGAFSPNFFPSS